VVAAMLPVYSSNWYPENRTNSRPRRSEKVTPLLLLWECVTSRKQLPFSKPTRQHDIRKVTPKAASCSFGLDQHAV
jgi:hypothetical protein